MPPSVTDLAVWGEYLLKLFVAMVLSGIIGVERQLRRKTRALPPPTPRESIRYALSRRSSADWAFSARERSSRRADISTD